MFPVHFFTSSWISSLFPFLFLFRPCLLVIYIFLFLFLFPSILFILFFLYSPFSVPPVLLPLLPPRPFLFFIYLLFSFLIHGLLCYYVGDGPPACWLAKTWPAGGPPPG